MRLTSRRPLENAGASNRGLSVVQFGLYLLGIRVAQLLVDRQRVLPEPPRGAVVTGGPMRVTEAGQRHRAQLCNGCAWGAW